MHELADALAGALAGAGTVLPLDAHDPQAGSVRAAMRPGEPVEDATTAIVPTSGSTGPAKGVLLSAHALTSSARATHARLGGPGRWLLATPAHYIGGIQVLVRSLLAGTRPAVLDLSAGFRPDEFAAAARPVLRGTGPRYTSLVPTQLTRILDAGGPALEAARAFDAIVVGGAATPAPLRRRAADAGLTVVSAYGMSETASGCVYDGTPLEGVGVHLEPYGDGAGEGGDGDTSSDAACDTGGVPGRIALSGDVLAHGYRADPTATSAAFSGGRFHTSDLGRFRADGRLDVLGRADDVVNTGGVKVPPALVERALLDHPGVDQACAVGIPDAEWGEIVVAAIVPTDPAGPPASEALAELARAAGGRTAVPKRIHVLDSFPELGPGKVDRSALRSTLTRPAGTGRERRA
ncbi:O-succinylbenzoic acid--CoA ligase [Haloechinothrix alba]|uniref:O-succinylbenzoic acid--CoA ligase n=1 Tax=Haloechinothrix alba TaxID=664784 RepID=A0A238YGR0_9PSEU|nr:O-succinylbenzoic acid--CoA ligase [Haloechinothrix alba]